MIKLPCLGAVLSAFLAVPVLVGAAPLGTAFTYQGQLKNSGSPVTAPCDFTFALFDASACGGQQGPTLTPSVPVLNGVFTVALDFGSQWNGDARFLDVTVQCPGDSTATSLGRQPLTGTPYSISTTQLQGQPVSQTAPTTAGQALVWGGSIWQPGAAIPGGPASGDLTGTYPNPTLSTAAAAGGRMVTAINASSSTVDAARLPSNIAYEDAGNTFTAANTFSSNVTFQEIPVFEVGLDAGGQRIRNVQCCALAAGTDAVNKTYVDNQVSASDRNIKADVVPVDPRQVLRAVLGLPISTWSYKKDSPEVRHIGAMAQDFHAAFQVGESDTKIMPIDAGGVAMASIQALHQEIEDRDAKIDALRVQIEALHALVCARNEDAPLCRTR